MYILEDDISWMGRILRYIIYIETRMTDGIF